MAIGEEIPKTNPAEITGDEGIEGVDRGAVQQMSGKTELPEHARRNRVHWDALAAEYAAPGESGWACNETSWGKWSVPESKLHVLPEGLAGKDVIELGCGTAYFSACLDA